MVWSRGKGGDNLKALPIAIDRIEYIDTLKGLLIILVIIGHTGINSGIQKWIYSFHMPLFLIISGFFYKFDSSVVSYKRMKRLLGPFLVYTVMAVVFPGLPWLIFKARAIEWEKVFFIKELVFFNTPIWFLIVLFFIEIKMNIIGRIFSNKQQATSNKQQATRLVLLILIQIFIIKYCPILPFGIRIGLASLSTFYIGSLCRENIEYLSSGKDMSNILLISLFVISMLLGYKFGRVDLYKMEFSANLYQYYILIAVNLLLWVEVSKRVINIEFLKVMGKNTIYILGLHYYILFFMRTGYKVLGLSEVVKDKIGIYFIEGVMAVIISYVIIRVKDCLVKHYNKI